MRELPALPEETIQPTSFPRLRLWKEVAILAQMSMELAWIVPWYRSLTRGTNQAETWRVFAIFGAIMLFFHWLSRLMNFLNIRFYIRRVILVGLLFAVSIVGLRYLLYFGEPVGLVELFVKPITAFADMFVLIPDEFVIILAMIFIAFRSIAIASQRTSAADMLVRFQLGMVMIVLYIMLNTLVTGETPGNIVFVFLFSGLIAVGTARMTVLEGLRGGREVPFDRKWFLGLLVSALVVILIAYTAAQFTKYPLFTLLIQVLTAVFSFIVGIILILLMPLFLVLISGLLWLLDNIEASALLPEFVDGIQTALNNLADLTNQLIAFAQNLLPDLSFTRPYLLVGAIILVITLGFAFLAINWLARNYQRLDFEDLESIFETGDWLSYLRRMVQNNLRKLGSALDGNLNTFNRDRWRAAERVRRIYQELVDTASELGVSRQEAETPLEYLPRLESLFSNEAREVAQITRAYIKIRYGEYPESIAEVEAIEKDWVVIRKRAKSMQKERIDSAAG
jgi:hypothetical protein